MKQSIIQEKPKSHAAAAVKGGGAVHFTLDRCRAMIKIHGPDQD